MTRQARHFGSLVGIMLPLGGLRCRHSCVTVGIVLSLYDSWCNCIAAMIVVGKGLE